MTADMDARTRRVYLVLLLAPLLLLAFLYLYPLSRVLWLSVTVPTLGFGNFERLFTSSGIQNVIWTTLRICVLTTALALLIGYAIAYAALHLRGWRGELLLFFVLLSFWLSVLIRAFAWLTLLQSRGVINTWLMSAGIIDAPLTLIRNEFGVVLGMVHYMIPYAALPLYANMKGIDTRLVPAARGLGASPVQAFLKVYLPMSLPGLISAGILTFIFSLGFYVTPALLGGGKTIMISEYIAVQINETLNWGLGSMLATSLLLAIFALLAVLSFFVDLRKVFGVK
ncbi:ABC transporter permease [Bosea sp. NBC_00550]|uniref:ABC transporter permease n=1 Tax=Bosea sp. NBC_00550 TaxID=2969621 RepID=UPI002232881B|nr:ABC transporter permease [Bosea sp. NBC_00550]UZF95501.1 ABC transporter permease [Bosea sp. NBC_00550]